MTISSGFFNSHNHDRLYDAEQLSSIFDGVIIDGVYENYGDAFMITANNDANSSVIVGTGRAWFDHTWTLNDSSYALQLDPPNEMLGRIDAIVIDVDHRDDVRKNSIIYIKGSESTPDIPPALVNEELHHQYPIAYITRPAGPDSPISQSQIDYQVGTTGECPIVTGILESQNLENIWQQLNAEFDEWWDGIKATLDENTVTNLQNQINELKEKIEGDDALVGLLTKPAYEAFKSGNYDMTIKSFSISSGLSNHNVVEDSYCGTMFLPDSSVAHVYLNTQKNSGGAGGAVCKYFKITVDIYSTDGVKKSFDSDNIPIGKANDNHFQIKGINVFPVSINTFPVEIGVLVMGRTDQDSSYFGETYVTLSITSGKNVNFSYQQFNDNIITLDKLSYMAATSHGYMNETGQRISCCGYWNYVIVCSVNSDNVLTNKMTQVSQGFYGREGNTGMCPSDIRVDSNSNLILVGPIQEGTPSMIPVYCIINPVTLDVTLNVVNNNGDMWNPDPDWLPPDYYVMYNDYTALYGEEAEGLYENKISDFSNNDTIVKKSGYFIGASNTGEAIPEGLITAINTSNGYIGIASTGNKMFIGTNGGAAILKAKASVPDMSTQQKLMWAKGYSNTENSMGYLYVSKNYTSGNWYSKYPWINYPYYPITSNAVILVKE